MFILFCLKRIQYYLFNIVVMSQTDKFANHLLACAVKYHNQVPEVNEVIPTKFNNTTDAIECFSGALHYEAHHSFQRKQSINDDNKSYIFNTINLDSDTPGIIVAEKSGKVVIKTCSNTTEPSNDLSTSTKPIKKKTDKQIKKEAETAKKRILAKLEKSKQPKQPRKKPEKKTQTKSEQNEKDENEDEKDENEDEKDDNEDEEKEKPKKKSPTIKQKHKAERKEFDNFIETMLQGDSEELKNIGSNVEEKELKSLEIYENPVPHERHITALNICQPNASILPALLWGEQVHLTYSEGIPTGIFMYHGPPGTGKTHRLIVELKKMLEMFPNEKFHVCAASNVGTINLYTRARDMGVYGTLVSSNVPDTISKEEQDKWNIKKDRVIFSTISMRNGKILKDVKFQCMLVDEAAMCAESWLWGLFRPELHRILLAGDPFQLPATVSEDGIKYQHGRSMMERLLSLGIVPEFLDIQKRMHPDIVAFPNKYFYNNKLKTQYVPHPKLKDIKAVEIINVQGSECKVGDSWINKEEANVIKELCDKFKGYNIVVIAPYQAQCKLLKTICKNIEIHTIDSFQGRESDVVFMCTVRCGKSVGFWEEDRRLNVAITRAKHILRIVGSKNAWISSSCALANLVKPN